MRRKKLEVKNLVGLSLFNMARICESNQKNIYIFAL